MLSEALPYLQRFSGKTMVIKYGGAAMKDPTLKVQRPCPWLWCRNACTRVQVSCGTLFAWGGVRVCIHVSGEAGVVPCLPWNVPDFRFIHSKTLCMGTRGVVPEHVGLWLYRV